MIAESRLWEAESRRGWDVQPPLTGAHRPTHSPPEPPNKPNPKTLPIMQPRMYPDSQDERQPGMPHQKHPFWTTDRSGSTPAKRSRCQNAYVEFCHEQRPLLPANLLNADRERLLSSMWKACSEIDKLKYTGAEASTFPRLLGAASGLPAQAVHVPSTPYPILSYPNPIPSASVYLPASFAAAAAAPAREPPPPPPAPPPPATSQHLSAGQMEMGVRVAMCSAADSNPRPHLHPTTDQPLLASRHSPLATPPLAPRPSPSLASRHAPEPSLRPLL